MIVIKPADTLYCKIKEVGNLFINYTIKENNKATLKNVPLKDVVYYEFNVQRNRETTTNNAKNSLEEILGRLEFYAGIGYSYLSTPIDESISPDFFKNYLEELRFGTTQHGGINYHIYDDMMIGFQFQQHKFSNRIDRILFLFTQDTVIGPLSDQIKLSSFTPNLSLRIGSFNRFVPYLTGGISYITYENKAELGLPLEIKAQSLSLTGSLFLNYMLDDHLSIYLSAGMHLTAFSDYEVYDTRTKTKYTLETYSLNNFNRIEMLVGVRYRLGRNNFD